MTFSANQFMLDALEKRESQNALRKLVVNENLIDFSSNDYLGFAKNKVLLSAIEHETQEYLKKQSNSNILGATGSRLLAGNSTYVENLEKKIAHFHKAESGLIFNSGYDANIGLFSALGKTNATFIYDELIHASVHDGMKLSRATTFKFKHNDINHLEERLKISQGLIYVVVESVYSMDGDESPLTDIVRLCAKHSANLIVDEAHATGVSSNQGKGLVNKLNIEGSVFARVHTFGKALGCHGAIVLGGNLLRDFLINFSRSFIYTTALPLQSLISINQAYIMLDNSDKEIEKLTQNISLFKNNLSASISHHLIPSTSAIQCIVVRGNDNVKKIAQILLNAGFDVKPILSPTVSKDKERLRICIHAFNTTPDIIKLCDSLNKNLME